MSPTRRNFWVGLVVLVAACLFVWMALRFGNAPVTLFERPQVQVEIDAPRVDGLSEGSGITYQGVTVGRITKLDRNPNGNGVTVTALLDTDPPVPINVAAEIRITNLIGGGAIIALRLQTDPTTRKQAIPIVEQKPTSQSYGRIQAVYIGLNLLPSEYGDTAAAIGRAAQAIADASEEIRQRDLVKHVDDTILNINSQVTRAGDVFADLKDLLGDPTVKGQIRETIANIHQSSASIARFSNDDLPRLSSQASGVLADAQSKLDRISTQMTDRLAEIAKVLNDIHSVTTKVNQGQGTAGMLVNDPKLYQALVDSAQNLNKTLLDLQRLSEQWEQDGLSLKLK
jgi:phospholipid/cholesterol/gamma-HCH transport system substrate-binding protein